MRRIRMLALIPAAALCATLLAGCGPDTENLPYCPNGTDLCLQGMGAVSAPGSIVKGSITIKTIHVPRAVEIYVSLWWKSGGKTWVEQDNKAYGLSSLPPVGQTKLMLPILESFCAGGYWAEFIHVLGTTSSGTNKSEWIVWPGAQNQAGTIQVSDSNIANSTWPGNLTKCAA